VTFVKIAVHRMKLMLPMSLSFVVVASTSRLGKGILLHVVTPTSHSPIKYSGHRRCRHLAYSSKKQIYASSTDIDLARDAFARLANRGKSWKRLRFLVDMAVRRVQTDDAAERPLGGIADVGTDHGLLAFGLAATGRFQRVVGIDVSDRSLRDGALKLNNEVTNLTGSSLKVDFRVSDGLEGLAQGEADTICIAGMGVATMIDILSTKALQGDYLLDELGCNRLILQSTSCKQRQLMRLYEHLHEMNWPVRDEMICLLSSRFYMSTLFERGAAENGCNALPGSMLRNRLERSADEEMRTVFHEWLIHNRNWIRIVEQQSGRVHELEQRWLNEFRAEIGGD
jgi:tRNA A22 N-methylase